MRRLSMDATKKPSDQTLQLNNLGNIRDKLRKLRISPTFLLPPFFNQKPEPFAKSLYKIDSPKFNHA